MFRSARLKLTAWYLLIIMVISLSFSLGIYELLTVELNRVERIHQLRVERGLPEGLPSPRLLLLDPNLIAEAKYHLFVNLALINALILLSSAAAGYFLAGRTLRPIAEMVDEQRRFVADASHELRTPLTAVKTETEVALRDKKLNKKTKQLLASNLEEIDKLKSLTDYFLTLNKYQDKGSKFPLQVFSLVGVVEEAVNRVSVLAAKKKIKILKNLEDVRIKANKASIIEVVTILLDNAIKYSHSGSKIKIFLQTKRDGAVIKVQDFGIGIKPQDLPLIFNRFYRADSSRTKNVDKGYGLGLSIAKSIVDLHQGKIIVQSVVNKGSTFTVFLPNF